MRNPGRETVTIVHRDVAGLDADGRVIYTETTEPTVAGRFVTLSAEESYHADRMIEQYDAALLVPETTNVTSSDEVQLMSPSPHITGRWHVVGVDAGRGVLRVHLRKKATLA